MAGSAADRAGLQPGDVVLLVGRTKVGSSAAFNQAVKASPAGQPVMLLVRRENVTQFVAISPEPAK